MANLPFPQNFQAIDQFNVADGPVSSAIWASRVGLAVASNLIVVSEQVAGSVTNGSGVTAADFSGDIDLQLSVVIATAFRIDFHMTNSDTVDWAGYELIRTGTTWTLNRHEPGPSTVQLATTSSGPVNNAGTKCGVRRQGANIEVYHHDGVSWNQTPVLSVVDATSNHGRAGLFFSTTSGRFDDFLGGSIPNVPGRRPRYYARLGRRRVRY